jgi:hypothetical protein
MSAIDYHNLMLDRLDETLDERIKALGEIERDKLRVARAHNKKFNKKSFQVGDLVWKRILPIRSKSSKFSDLKVASSGSSHQIWKGHIELRK